MRPRVTIDESKKEKGKGEKNSFAFCLFTFDLYQCHHLLPRRHSEGEALDDPVAFPLNKEGDAVLWIDRALDEVSRPLSEAEVLVSDADHILVAECRATIEINVHIRVLALPLWLPEVVKRGVRGGK